MTKNQDQGSVFLVKEMSVLQQNFLGEKHILQLENGWKER